MNPPPAGRPREFDADQVLQSAMEAFWERGYDATSVSDLLEATGLQKGSLYQAFGDKRSLYLSVLRRYLDAGASHAAAALGGAGSPRELLARWLEQSVAGCDGAGGRGCFAVNAQVELGPRDEDVGAALEAHFRALGRLLEGVVARGQAQGELRGDASAKDLADFLLVFLTGLQARARWRMPRARARKLVASALAALEP